MLSHLLFSFVSNIIKSLYSFRKEMYPMASVTYDHVTKRFGEVLAVNDLDIAIEDKEFY